MKLAKLAKKKPAPKKQKSPFISAKKMDALIGAQQAVRARNEWRQQIRDSDARAQRFLQANLMAQRNPTL